MTLVSVCHLLYTAAEVKFGILAAQNAVVTLLVSRVITPNLLRASQQPLAIGKDASPVDRISELSRLLQRVAHFAHHDNENARSQASTPDLSLVLKHVAALRELVSRLLALPPDPTLGLVTGSRWGNHGLVEEPTEEAEMAALWLVDTCRRWVTAVPADSSAADDAPGRLNQQQLAGAARTLARLG